MSESQQQVAPESTRHAGGRPTRYRPELSERARELRRRGATDKDLAAVFGVSESTLNKWKTDHPEFSESVRAGSVATSGTPVAAAHEAAWPAGSSTAEVPPATYYARLVAARRRQSRESRLVQVAFEITSGPCAGAVILDDVPDSTTMGARLVNLTIALGGRGAAIEGCIGATCRLRVVHRLLNDGLRLAIAQADAI